LNSRLGDGIEDRHFVVEHLAPFARRHTCDYDSSVFHALARVKRTSATGYPLNY
jgi:hypothetical protein